MLGQEKILTLYSILLFFKFSRVIFFKVNFLKNSKLFVKKKNIFFRKKIKNNFFSFNYKLVSSDIFSLFKFYKNTNLRLIFFNKRINFYFCKSSFKTLNFNFFKSNLRKNSKNLNMLHMKKKNILNKIFFKNALKFFFLKKKHKKFDKKKTFIFSKVLSKRYKFKW